MQWNLLTSSRSSAKTNTIPCSRVFRLAVMMTIVPQVASAQGPIFDETDPRSLGSCFCNDTAAADLDGDGDLDVIHTHNCIMEAVSWNDGNGYFPTSTVVHTGGCAETGANIVLADYDHDNDLDLLFGSPSTYGTMWYRNDGEQSFTGIVPIVDVVVAAAHLNEDDYIDLCARGGLVYLNDQAGGFVLSQDLALSSSGGGLLLVTLTTTVILIVRLTVYFGLTMERGRSRTRASRLRSTEHSQSIRASELLLMLTTTMTWTLSLAIISWKLSRFF